MSVCPECAGAMKFDRSSTAYVCQNCGLSLSREDYFNQKRREQQKTESPEERRRKEYLKWWLSSKKE